MILTLEDYQIIAQIAEARERKYLHVETIRLLAGTEENYRIIIREIDRIQVQLARARGIHAPATLTLMEWFTILDRYNWMCAYCKDRPFQSLHHIDAQSKSGTTAENCLPTCYSCRGKRLQRSKPT